MILAFVIYLGQVGHTEYLMLETASNITTEQKETFNSTCMGENSVYETISTDNGHYLARTSGDTVTLILFSGGYLDTVLPIEAYTIMLINQ